MRTSELNATFEYRNGDLYWKKSGPGRSMGVKAGCVINGRYRAIRYQGRLQLTHRLIFFMFHGYVPRYVDHINQDKLDNRIENLRAATKQQNGANAKLSKRNTSGYKGVYFNTAADKWQAYIGIDGKQNYIGVFTTPEDAAIAYNKKATEVFGEFATLNTVPA